MCNQKNRQGPAAFLCQRYRTPAHSARLLTTPSSLRSSPIGGRMEFFSKSKLIEIGGASSIEERAIAPNAVFSRRLISTPRTTRLGRRPTTRRRSRRAVQMCIWREAIDEVEEPALRRVRRHAPEDLRAEGSECRHADAQQDACYKGARQQGDRPSNPATRYGCGPCCSPPALRGFPALVGPRSTRSGRRLQVLPAPEGGPQAHHVTSESRRPLRSVTFLSGRRGDPRWRCITGLRFLLRNGLAKAAHPAKRGESGDER